MPLDRCRVRRCDLFSTRINLRKAEFTDRSPGKCRAISGDRNTRFVPALYRAAYLPRTPPLNFARLYSLRSSSGFFRFSVFLFISCLLGLRCFSGACDSDALPAIGMGNQQEPSGTRGSSDNEPLFLDGVIRIQISNCQWVAKNSGRFVERDSVLSNVPCRFQRVPFKIHSSILLQ